MSGYTEVFAWGGDHHGQLGLATRQPGKTYNIPRYCSFNVFIKELACGEEHAAFITLNGEVYTMGNNAEGRLGIGNRSIKQCASPCLVDALSAHRAVSISCGWGHTAAVTESGELFTWGAGEQGALGLGSIETQWVPTRVNLPQDISAISVSCGARHTAVIIQTRAAMKELLACGAGEAGQLGTGRREKELQFVRVSFADAVKQVSCGVFHTGFITPTGRVYMMGGNSFGQLGVGSKKSSSLPMRVTALDSRTIIKVSCGHHSAAVSDRGELYLWGTGSFGEYLIPQPVSNIGVKVADVSVGGSFGAAIDVNNGLWTWGSNTNGELGVGDYEPRLTPYAVTALQGKRIRVVSSGSSFCIALGQDIGLGDPTPTKKRPVYQSENSSVSIKPTHVRAGTAYNQSSPLRTRNLHTPDVYVEKETLKEYYSEVKGELNRLKETAGGVNDLRRALDDAVERYEEVKRRLDKETLRSRRLEEDLLEERHKRDIDISDLQSKQSELSSQKTFTEKLARERTEFEHLFIDRDNQMRAMKTDLDHLNAEIEESEGIIDRKEKELEQVTEELERFRTLVGKFEGEQRSLNELLSRKETEISTLKLSIDREKRTNEDILVNSKRELSLLEQEKRALESDLMCLQRDFEVSQKEHIACKQELRELLTTKENLLNELKALREKLNYKEIELGNVRRELEVVSRERKMEGSRVSQLQEILSTREGEIEALKLDLNQSIHERKLTIDDINTELKSLQQEKNQLELALEQQIRTSNLYRNSLDENQRKFEVDSKRKEEEQNTQIAKMRETYENRINSLLSQLTSFEDQNLRLKKDYENAVLTIRRTEETANLYRDKTESENKRKEEEKMNLTENYEAKLSLSIRELNELREIRSKLERELTDSVLKCKSLEEKIRIETGHFEENLKMHADDHSKTINRTIDSYENRLNLLQKQLSEEQNSKRLLSKDLETALIQVKRMEETLKVTTEQGKSDVKQVNLEAKNALMQLQDSYEAKIATLNRQLSDEKDGKMALEREINAIVGQKRRLEENIESEMRKEEALNREISDLKTIIEGKNGEIRGGLEDIESGKHRERDLMQLRDELRQELERQKALIVRLQTEIKEKDAVLTDLNNHFSASKQENSQLHGTINELKYEIEALVKQNHDNLAAMDKLHEINEELNEKYQVAVSETHEFQVQVTELEAKNRELFLTFEKELSNRAREFRERTLGVLGTPSPLRPAPTSSPPTHKHVSIHSSVMKSPLTTATSVSKQLDKFRDESPERRAELGLRTEAEQSYQQRISRAAARLADSLGMSSPITSMRISSPMRQSVSRFRSPGKSSLRQSHSPMERHEVQRIEEDDEHLTDS